MTDPDDAVAFALMRMRDEMTFRRTLLLIYSFFGVAVGTAIILTGAPTPIEVWFGPWPRYALGGLGVMAGLLVFLGLVKSDTTGSGWRATVAGVASLWLWQALVLAAYTAAAFINGSDVLAFNEPANPHNFGRAYIPFVYLTLLLSATSHLVMLWKVRPRAPLVP